MLVLVTAANGKTGRHITAALRAHPSKPQVRALSRSAVAKLPGVEPFPGDMNDLDILAQAAKGVDAVVHYYGPPFHPRETAMGINVIEAAKAAGVRRFVYVSVIHPQIDDLMNHKVKLAVEAYLINSKLDWTILRPQHYMQNIDVARVLSAGALHMPYPVGTTLGHVDMRDLAEAAAKVLVESGHSYASYDVAANEHLSVSQISDVISRLSGKPVRAGEMAVEDIIPIIAAHYGEPMPDHAVEGLYRLFGYYGRHGIVGNANVLTWLLGRSPSSFESYVKRCLAGDAGPVPF